MQTATTGIKEELLQNKLLLKNVLEMPFGAEAIMLREDQIKDGIKTIGFVPVIQKDLQTLIQATDFNAGNEKEAQLASIIGMVYTLAVEDRIEEMYEAMKKGFPEYYL